MTARRMKAWMGATVAGAALIVTMTLSGCLQSEGDAFLGEALAAAPGGEGWVEAWDPTSGPALPTIEELESELGLTQDQSERMAAALEKLADSMRPPRGRGQGPRGGRGGPGGGRGRPGRPPHGMPGGFGDGESPFLEFVEESFEILEPAQIVPFAELLEEKRSEARPESGSGKPGGPGHGRFFGRMLKQLTEELDLSDEQLTEAREALQASAGSYHELRVAFMEGEITAEGLRDQSREIRIELEGQLQTILGQEAYEQLEEILAEHRTEMAERLLSRLAERTDRRARFLARVLALDETQVSEARQILESFLPRRQSLLEAIRDGEIEIEEALYQGYVISEETADALRQILTAEQLERFEAIRILLPGHGRGPRR